MLLARARMAACTAGQFVELEPGIAWLPTPVLVLAPSHAASGAPMYVLRTL